MCIRDIYGQGGLCISLRDALLEDSDIKGTYLPSRSYQERQDTSMEDDITQVHDAAESFSTRLNHPTRTMHTEGSMMRQRRIRAALSHSND